MDSRCVLHPAPERVGMQYTSQITILDTILEKGSEGSSVIFFIFVIYIRDLLTA